MPESIGIKLVTIPIVPNWDVLVAVAALAFLVYRLIDAVVKPLLALVNAFLPQPGESWRERVIAALVELKGLWPQYVAIGIGTVITWYTGLNLVPIFPQEREWLGRLLTALIGGVGPSFIYDLTKGLLTFLKSLQEVIGSE